MAQRHLFCNELELEIMYVQNALDAGNEKRKDIKIIVSFIHILRFETSIEVTNVTGSLLIDSTRSAARNNN